MCQSAQSVSNFLSFVSAKHDLNWFTVEKVITKIKRVNFLLRHSVQYYSIHAHQSSVIYSSIHWLLNRQFQT